MAKYTVQPLCLFDASFPPSFVCILPVYIVRKHLLPHLFYMSIKQNAHQQHQYQHSMVPYNELEKIWKNCHCHKISKFFNTRIMSVLLYGGEPWKWTTDTGKINSFKSKCLWNIFRIHWKSFLATSEILRRANQPNAANVIRRQWWTCLVHTL